MPRDQLGHPVVDLAEAVGQGIARSGAYDAAFDEAHETQPIAANDSVTGVCGTGIDTKNEHSRASR